ncbi:MAG: flagellar basal body-associated FliL family protein [Lachnospiraceae bacterium]|nr:flagellar basal body-associated FliL family protein [Lachnospiraceae bacterium]
MKKNMISVIILALLVVNIVMTAIMMFTVIPANRKSIALVDQVASAIKLDTAGVTPEGSGNSRGVSLADTATATIEDQQTFQLKKGEDGNDHYVVCTVAVLMDTTHEDYETYGADILESRQSLILNALSETIGQYTYEDVQALGQSGLQDACLEKLQELFGSAFIYQVAFSGYIVQ